MSQKIILEQADTNHYMLDLQKLIVHFRGGKKSFNSECATELPPQTCCMLSEPSSLSSLYADSLTRKQMPMGTITFQLSQQILTLLSLRPTSQPLQRP